ncbi:MAG: peptidase [Azospirillum sp.]|nr:peptidase [Azospirillum sp.]
MVSPNDNGRPSLPGESSAAGSSLPLFYRAPVALRFETHAYFKVRTITDYRFAQGTNSIPLAIEEFMLAARDYPVLFASGTDPVPIALVGLGEHRNLFVDAATGAWQAGTYLPAYVRRYPFVLQTTPQPERFIVCVEHAELIETGEGIPLFNADGQLTPEAAQRVDFCRAFMAQGTLTQEFSTAVRNSGILEAHTATIETPDRKRLQLTGFEVVNRERFASLPDETILAWHKNGWLGLIHAHFASTVNWQKLVDLLPR